MLLMRFVILVTEHISKHPDFRDPGNRAAFKQVAKLVPGAMTRMEYLKPHIEKDFRQYEKVLEERRKRELQSGGDSTFNREKRRSYEERDSAIAGRGRTLKAEDHKELAATIVQKELRRRDKLRASRRDGVRSEGTERFGESDELQSRMTRLRQRLDSRSPDREPRKLQRPSHRQPSPGPSQTSSSVLYPSIHKSGPVRYDNNEVLIPVKKYVDPYAAPPSLPPKAWARDNDYYDTPQPLRPPKPTSPNELFLQQSPPTRPAKLAPAIPSTTPSPTPEASAKATYFKPSAYLENGEPLRTVFISPYLRDRFLQAAAANTRANIETCGMLCGTVVSNALFVTKLVIPEQEGTSDTCETTNEVAFYEYCFEEEVMQIGWIHTHPTQTCFMSSRDVHTHAGYQCMMAEAISIVCAPSRNE
jgi:STAM-binding protein